MDFDKYQELAERTYNKKLSYHDGVAMCTIGLAGEAGEVSEIIKKWLYHGKYPESSQIRDEMGDVLWYLANLATLMGWSLEAVAESNIDKLKARYPDGFKSADGSDD